jgi:hypothetical protein
MLFYNKRIFERCFRFTGFFGWIKNIPLYFKQMHHLITRGYDVEAEWDTFGWFIDKMKLILTGYRNQHYGTKMIDDNCTWEENAEKWNGIIDRMIELLDLMDECNPKYDGPEYEKDIWLADREMNAAKDEFFQLFAKCFYYLWD